ncbi:hypothetical protein [Luteolibacter luteus]|uniref:Uncharacterized protein n=1 Tax=Luteolibacter luteus TaxID=2728835 RepID=A0A858RLJ0_9BACT|nr:hypothetical protein [Luteolibacter luteus]QJE97328.1 hypothetical protein HHL09_16540 [Luteolibacter luteus]
MTPPPKPIHQLLALLMLPVGALLIIGAKLGTSMIGTSDSPAALLVLSLVGAIIWVWGCIHFAIASKLSPALGFLGLFFIAGFLILLFVAKKQPEWERSKMRRFANNPKKEYRGDPDSLY